MLVPLSGRYECQVVVQRALKPCCRLDFVQKEFVLLIVGYFNPFSGSHILSPFSGLPRENGTGGRRRSELYREASRLTNVASCTVSFVTPAVRACTNPSAHIVCNVVRYNSESTVRYVHNVMLGAWSSSVGTGWTVRGSYPGGSKIFRSRPHRPAQPPVHLVSAVPRGKVAGAGSYTSTCRLCMS